MLRAARRWEPTEGQARRDGVAFSYLRADLNIEEVWAYRTQGGFIADMSGHSGYPLGVRCVFPYDGATDTRPDGCGEVLGGGTETPRNSARSLQSRFRDKTGRWVPIVRVDLRAGVAAPFTYRDEDQSNAPL